MNIHSKTVLIVLALALSCSPLLAQDDPQGPPPQQQRGGWRGFGPSGRPGGVGDDGDRGGRGGDMRRGFGRGDDGPMGGFGMGRREFGLGRLLNDPAIRQQVGISAEQAAKIRQQESDFRKTAIRDRADVQVKRIDLQDLLAADKPDRAAIDSKLQEISVAQLALEKAAVDQRLNMRDAITPAQREKLRQLMMNRRRPGGGGPSPSGGPQGAGRRGPRPSGPPPAGSQARPPAGPPPSTN
jgi:Spy/CpxP family protein refolding chaperone